MATTEAPDDRGTMRAAQYDRYGPPEVLYLAHRPIPAVRPDEVLVRVAATTVNGGELFGRDGRLRWFLGRGFPKRVGLEFVGEVVATGAEVTEPAVGSRVWGTVPETTLGAAADHVATPAWRVAPAPANLSDVDAVSLIAGGTTAITGLREHAGLRAGERVLIRGAAGGVGSVAVQVAKLFGAHVTALAGTGAQDFVRGLGADDVLDYTVTGPRDLGRYDVVTDIVGRQQWQYRKLLAPGGRMVAIGLDPDHLLRSFGYVALSTVHGSGRVRFFRGKPDRRLLTELSDHAERGSVRPVVDRVFALERIVEAHRALAAGGVRGKVVVSVG